MKNLIIIALCFFAVTASAQKTQNIDAKNSMLNWTGHAEIGSYAPAGTLAFKSGQVKFKGDQISSAVLLVDMKSLAQQNNNLAEHLKSEDFFDVEKYPQSTIKINKIENGKAYGELTIKNKTLPVVCPVNISKSDGKTTITGTLVIDRTSYGITYNSGSFFSGLGDKAIRNTFEVSYKVVVNN